MMLLMALALMTPPSLLELINTGVDQPAMDVAKLYGDEHSFDIYRKGKKIGESVTTFRTTDQGLEVSTETDMKVKILFITAYKLDMESRELWDGRGMAAVSSDIDNNGKDVKIMAARTPQSYVWESFEGERFEAPLSANLFPTSHWHPSVLARPELFNTLTGLMLEKTVTSAGWEQLETAGGMIEAERFDYDWELEPTSSWYDRDGRWVGLEISATDGSKITYVCRTCSTSGTRVAAR